MRRTLLAAFSACLAAATAGAQATFEPLPGIFPSDMSSDGTTVVGTLGLSGPAAMWTAGGGTVNLGGSGGSVAISADGSTVVGDTVGTNGDNTAGIWQGGTSWLSLEGIPGQTPCGSDLSSAYGTSGDGSVVVGLGWISGCSAHGFRWEQNTGMVDLGSLTSRSSRANAISNDARVIVGWNDEENGFRRAAKWVDGVEEWVSPTVTGEANGTNSDGSVIVGGFAGPGNVEAWRWTEANGLEPIGKPPGPPNHRAFAAQTSEDGRVIVGFSGFGADRDAFIWIEGAGIFKLDTYLADCGATIPSGWDLATATTISADGTVISGWGFGPSGLQGWIARIPLLPTNYCTAKVNSCGTLPALSTTGLPSAAATSGFELAASNAKAASMGLLIYGESGPTALPFEGGLLCVAPKLYRSTPIVDSSGTGSNCDGVLSIDMNAFAQGLLGGNPQAFLLLPGTVVNGQFWGRDTMANGSLLSDAVEYGICP